MQSRYVSVWIDILYAGGSSNHTALLYLDSNSASYLTAQLWLNLRLQTSINQCFELKSVGLQERTRLINHADVANPLAALIKLISQFKIK